MIEKYSNSDSLTNKESDSTPKKTSTAKPQENYPGPRKTGKAPEFVKDWEAEPPQRVMKSNDEQCTPQDLAIEHCVWKKLKKEMNGVESILIHVSNGEVTLTGTVRYEAVKSNAALLTRDCEGVTEVHNHLNIE